ncbi:uncharacterized protein [Chironomus tepperi]|uniref:uncharacterized protein n=1 Tax=Chironomus tepperi TaxID=113505 RepID=UPI00391EFBA7
MSQNISEESKSTEIHVVLSNFQGLQYDIDEDTEYEVIASYVNNILSNDCFQINHKSIPEIIIKIPIDIADENQVSDLFSNRLLLTLIKHENENADTVGYSSIDLSDLCSIKCESIKIHKQFKAIKVARKISFDVNAATNIPLMNTANENCMNFTLESVYSNNIYDKILICLNAPIEAINNATFNVTRICEFGNSSLADNDSKNIQYDETDNSAQFDDRLCSLSCQSYQRTNVNATFKSVIFTKEACLALHDHIRKYEQISMELMLNNDVHLFGLIDCEKLLHVGCRTVRCLVPLYRFDNELFNSYTQCNSKFYKPEVHLMSKNSKRISRKTQINNENKSLEDIKALDDEGKQIFVVVLLKLQKSLNEEVSIDTKYSHGMFKYDNSMEWDVVHQKSKTCKTENSIFTKIKILFDHFRDSCDDEDFACSLVSNIGNSEKIPSNNECDLILVQIYKSLGMINKAEDILLHNIHNDPNSEAVWLNYTIFNAKQEDYDKMAVAIDEMQKINPQSLISNILNAYLLFKSHKYPACLNLISNLQSRYGNIEELGIMQYVINAMLGIENSQVNKGFTKNKEIENIYSRTDNLWLTASDECFLSCQNSFIKSAVFFINIGCYDIAELCLGEYYQSYGININYLYLLAAIDSSKGCYKEALYHLNRISENDVANHSLNHSKIAKSIILNLLHIKNFKKAADIFNTYIEMESCDNFLILFHLGSYFNRINEFIIAKEFLIQAAKLYQCQLIFQELGKCFMALTSIELAEKAFLNAIQYDINDIDTIISLKEIYKIQDRHDALDICG